MEAHILSELHQRDPPNASDFPSIDGWREPIGLSSEETEPMFDRLPAERFVDKTGTDEFFHVFLWQSDFLHPLSIHSLLWRFTCAEVAPNRMIPESIVFALIHQELPSFVEYKDRNDTMRIPTMMGLLFRRLANNMILLVYPVEGFCFLHRV